MKLQEIDKVVYRKHLNVVTIALVASLIIFSLLFGTGLIALFGEVNPTSGEATGNFQWNLLGVILAAVLSVSALMGIKDHVYLKEVYYIWKLKAVHNRIYRRLKQVKAAAESGEVDAFIILSFYYQSLKLVYQLDNNTLTLNKVQKDINELEANIEQRQLSISSEDFDVELLSQF